MEQVALAQVLSSQAIGCDDRAYAGTIADGQRVQGIARTDCIEYPAGRRRALLLDDARYRAGLGGSGWFGP